MKMRRLALALAGAAAIALLSPATALAAPAPAPPSTFKLPNGTTFNPQTAKCTTVKTTTGNSERCVQVQRLPLKYLTSAQSAERQSMMARAPQETRASATALPTAPAECGFSTTEFANTFTASPSRFLSCADSLLSLTVFQISPFPELLGEFFWEDQQWIDESAASLTWTLGLQVLGYTGLRSATWPTGSAVRCTPAASWPRHLLRRQPGRADPQTVAIVPGGIYNFGWDESDTGPALTKAGAVDTLNPFLGVDWNIAAAGQTASFTDVGALDERCDNAAQTDVGDPGDDSTVPPVDTGPGCVDQNNIPTLFLSLALTDRRRHWSSGRR